MPQLTPKQVAVQAARDAGRYLLSEYEKFDRAKIEIKSQGQILTQADVECEKRIITAIKTQFPDHAFLAEESGEDGVTSECLWVIDPIDGTTNFSYHNPMWSISIALVKNGEFELGVVYVPKLREMFVAEKGKGAKLNGKSIHVSNIFSERAIHTYCHGGEKENIDRAMDYAKTQKLSGIDCRQIGSAAIELAYVASGRVESIFIPGAKPWDVAAGVLLVKEAGGWVTQADGSYFTLKSTDIVASNAIVHKQILELIQR